jgi:2-polyprenyl-3-methyl-5-hydroxy-6-metoxy-1,4-benzoquinol methylase
MFKERSYKKELLDAAFIPDEDLFQNLKELNSINTLLGGYNITFNALHKVLDKSKTYHLVDIGCGGGDTLKHINKWSKKNNYTIALHGIDLKQSCINYSVNNNTHQNINFICDDYRNIYKHLIEVSIIHACLFCHHLTKDEIIDLIKFSINNKAILIINDLERNPIAYYAIKFLTRLFSKSYLVKNDAPLSVLRGFKKREWLQLMKDAGAKNYSVKYKWAFRHQVIVYAD